MKRVFKTKQFAKFAVKAALVDAILCQAVAEMEQGLIDADLGGGVLKKRIALPGKGKRGGARTIVAQRQDSHWFLYSVLRKMTVPTFRIAKRRRCKSWQAICFH